MKLRDITNSKCDVRKYMSIEVSDEARYELENWDYDVDDVLRQARIYIDGHKLDDEIIPFNVEKNLELNPNQQIVLEWLKEEKEERCSFESAIYWYFEDDVEPDIISDRLTQIEFLQVLAAFAEWGIKEVAE